MTFHVQLPGMVVINTADANALVSLFDDLVFIVKNSEVKVIAKEF